MNGTKFYNDEWGAILGKSVFRISICRQHSFTNEFFLLYRHTVDSPDNGIAIEFGGMAEAVSITAAGSTDHRKRLGVRMKRMTLTCTLGTHHHQVQHTKP